jgi:hypothetical protein
MPPVGAAIAAVAGSVFGGSAIGGFLVKLGLGVGLNYLAGRLTAKSSADMLADEQRPVGTKFKLAGGGRVPRAFILGRWATSGSLVFHGTWGESVKIPNARYVQVAALSDLPVSDLRAVLVNGRELTYDPDGNQSPPGQPIPQYNKGDKDNFWVRFRPGNQTEVDPYLDNRFSGSGSYSWDSSFVGTGIAYAMWTARYNEKLWTSIGEINVTYVVDGLKLYDIRKDTTAGGSGAHRWNDPSTWEFTRNPVVMIYNIMRGLRYDGAWVYGGQTIAASQMPFASWAAAANECDADVATKNDGTQPQFRAGGEIEFSSEPLDIIDRLLMTCNGKLADGGGIYTIHVGAAGTAVFSIHDDDIIIDEEQTFEPFPGHDQTVNGITSTYVAQGAGWTEKSAPPLHDAALEAEDGGRRLVASVNYDFVSNTQQVQRLMKAALLEARRFRRHAVVLPPVAMRLDPLDFIEWTSPRNGYSSKLFRVDEIAVRANLDVVVYLTEVDPSDYDWDADLDEADEFQAPSFFDPPTVPALQDWTATGVIIQGDGGRSVAGIRLSWDPDPDADNDGAQTVSRIDFEVRHAASEVLVYASNTPFVSAGAIDISQNISAATQYQVRGRYWSPTLDSTWTGWINVTTPDVRILFDELEAAYQYYIRLIHEDIEGSFKRLKDRIQGLHEEQSAGTLVDIFEQYHQRKVLLNLLVREGTDRKAAILQLAEAMVTGDEAVAELITGLEAQFGDSIATLTSQMSTVAGATTANASAITAVQVLADNATAGGFMRLQAIGGSGGATSRFDLQINVGTPFSTNFKSSGFYMEIVGSGASATSRIMFDVDQFMVGSGTSKTLMLEMSGGQVKMRSALIGVLTADNIGAGIITADKLNVTSLSAISANVGLLTAGLIRDHASSSLWKMQIDLANGQILIRD